MAVVTFGAVLIALRTLSAIRDQVIANKDAAQAAKDSPAAALEEAKAISASERAYVFARVEYEQPFSINVDGTFFARLQAQFINHGKTPAWMLPGTWKRTFPNSCRQTLPLISGFLKDW